MGAGDRADGVELDEAQIFYDSLQITALPEPRRRFDEGVPMKEERAGPCIVQKRQGSHRGV